MAKTAYRFSHQPCCRSSCSDCRAPRTCQQLAVDRSPGNTGSHSHPLPSSGEEGDRLGRDDAQGALTWQRKDGVGDDRMDGAWRAWDGEAYLGRLQQVHGQPGRSRQRSGMNTSTTHPLPIMTMLKL